MTNEPDQDTSTDTFTSTTSVPESETLSIASDASLIIPGKLYSDITNLRNCYIDILQQFSTDSPGNITTDTPVLLTHEQMEKGITANKILKDKIKSNLFSLIDFVRPICLPPFQPGVSPVLPPAAATRPGVLSGDVEELQERVELLAKQNKEDCKRITDQLESLQQTVVGYQQLAQRSAPTVFEPIPLVEGVSGEHGCEPVHDFIKDFISAEMADDLLSTLKDIKYEKSKGRSTAKFGEQYTYSGSKGKGAQFLPCLKTLLDKINNRSVQVNPHLPLYNSCVVTKYVGSDSYIPFHSDDEQCIHPDSSIITVSLGKDADITFRDIHTNATQSINVSHGSAYLMSRKSQDLFRHSVPQNPGWKQDDVRISLTFRSVHWRNNNSTLIMGDSNTGGLNFANFGSKASTDMNGTFGNAMPGDRHATYTVDMIEPLKGTGYSNIVIHTGLNDIRQPSIKTDEDIKSIYARFKTKIHKIMNLNKRARIYVSPIFVTKNDTINKKIAVFNKLIVSDLVKSYPSSVTVVRGESKFSDNLGRLDVNLSREFTSDGKPDELHLNEAGLRILSVNIKNAIFYRKLGSRLSQGPGTRTQKQTDTAGGSQPRDTYRIRGGGHPRARPRW